MESCELYLILQPFRLLEMRSYALNCSGIKGGNVTPMSRPRPEGNVPAFFLRSDPSYAEAPYCCLYCHAARNSQ